METPSDVFYLSAATSPRSVCSLEDSLNFYSAPTSPTSGTPTTFFGFDRDFEDVEKSPVRGRSGGDSLSMISFADELFCDGKVVPLAPRAPQLKLPPGFRIERDSAVLGLPISGQCLWNDDFDPFMVALENVKKEERRMNGLEGNKGRRARSLSLRVVGEKGVDSNGAGKPNGSVSARLASSLKSWEEDEKSPNHGMVSDALKSKMIGSKGLPAEPKGVVFARRVRRVKMGQEKLGEPTASPAQRPKLAKGKMGWGIQNKRPKIMRLLFRVSSGGKQSSTDGEESKQRHQNGAFWKQPFLRRFSFRSIGQTQYNRDKKVVSHVAKITLIQYRRRFSLCMGYGAKYMQ